MPEGARDALIADLPAGRRLEVLGSWEFVARPEQLPPGGEWSVWLILAGRGFGKTRTGAEWITARARAMPEGRFAMVGTTAHDARDVMLEGQSGVLAVAPRDFRPEWRAARRLVVWPNGAQASLLSAAEPDQLRGPQFHGAWCDELAAWARPRETWDNLRMTLRLGARPQAVVTTTPRPDPLLRQLIGAPGVVVTRGTTFDNRANLPAAFLADLTANYAGTAIGRQEVMGELLEGAEGALWTIAGLDALRVREAPELVRVVVGVDPPAGPGGCGIVVAGIDAAGIGHVVADASVSGAAPSAWAGAVAAAFRRHEADRIVVEVNNGGAMVEAMLEAVGERLPVRPVRATRGKAARAEPVAALYEKGRVRHVGAFPALEDEMCGLIAGGGYVGPGTSPDRADALVWALTDLMLGPARAVPGVRAWDAAAR